MLCSFFNCSQISEFFNHNLGVRIDHNPWESPYFLNSVLAISAVLTLVWITKNFLDSQYQPLIDRANFMEKRNISFTKEIIQLKRETELLNNWYKQIRAEGKAVPSSAQSEDDIYYTETQNDTPSEYICCITEEVMRDPVYVKGDGRCYEREALQAWFNQNKGRCCPINREAHMVNPRALPTDVELKNKIDTYITEKKQKNCSVQNRF